MAKVGRPKGSKDGQRTLIPVTCQHCGTVVLQPPSKSDRPFCGRECAAKGQHRSAWNKGKSKGTDSRIASIAAQVSRFYRANPDHNRGANHFRTYTPVSEATRAKMRANRQRQAITPAMRAALEHGRRYFKGRTKETDASVARRAGILSAKYVGVPNPAHSERMRRYYAANPEKHPIRILFMRGHETRIERLMREALTAAGIPFAAQFPVGRFFGDFALPEHRLIVEVDGEHWHDAERDARRDAKIALLGWRVIRFTGSRVTKDVHGCVSDLRKIIE